MIAVAASLFLLFYVLVPGGIFRLVTSLVVPLKKYHKTKTQEITFACAACFFPLCVAMIFVWFIAPWPLAMNQSKQVRREQYRIVFATLQSDKVWQSALDHGQYWPALNGVLRRQARFLGCYYILMIVEAWLFWKLASGYAKLEDKRWYDWFAGPILFSSISEWHMILTNFALPAEALYQIHVDILSTEGVLYRGRLSDSFFNSDGELTGVLLEEPYRFDRDQYIDHKKADVDALIAAKPKEPAHYVTRARESYWRPILGGDDLSKDNFFYIPKETISNLNVRHQAPKVPQATESRLVQKGIKEFTISDEPPEQ
jgi:hypothetical protein